MKIHFLRLIFFILILIGFQNSHAQTYTGYTDSTTLAKYPFIEIAATQVGNSCVTPSGSTFNATNNNTSFSLGLPFTYTFAGTPVNTITVNSNGFVTFSGTVSTPNAPQSLSNLSGTLSSFVLWSDLAGINSLRTNTNCGGVFSATTGTSPNRVFTVQFNNMPRKSINNSESTFQIQLHENQNVMVFRYKSLYNSGTGAFAGQVASNTAGADVATNTPTANSGIVWNPILVDHYEVVFDGSNQALTCLPQDITIRACSTSTTPCTNTSDQNAYSSNLTLSTTGGTFSNNSNTVTKTLTGSTTEQLKSSTTLTATVSSSTTTPICFYSGTTLLNTDCTSSGRTGSVTFADAGFVFDWLTNNTLNESGVVTAGNTSSVLKITALQKTNNSKTCSAFNPTNTNFNIFYSNPTSGTENLTITPTNSSGTGAINYNVSTTNTAVPLTWNSGVAYFKVKYLDSGQININASGTSSINATLSGTTNLISKPNLIKIYNNNNDVTCSNGTVLSADTTQKFCPSGENFSTKIRAFASDNITTLPNFGNETTPTSVSISSSIKSPIGGSAGTISTSQSAWACSNGDCFIPMTLSWNNVGEVYITASVSDFLGTGSVSGNNLSFGRFYPFGFITDSSSIINRSSLSCSPSSSFTYMGEPFQIVLNLKAVNKQNNITSNYSSSFDPTLSSSWNIGALNNSTNLSSRISFISGTGSWTNGTLNALLTLKINRDTTPGGPYSNLSIGISPIDTDGTTYSSYNLDIDQNGTNDKKSIGTTKVYFGRMNIANSSGSDILPQTIALTTQTFNGIGFITNSEDSCTTLNSARFSTSNFTNQISNNEVSLSYPSIVNTGTASISLSKPSGGDGKYAGTFDLFYDLNNDSKSYLFGNYVNSSLFTDNPKGTITIQISNSKPKILLLKPTP